MSSESAEVPNPDFSIDPALNLPFRGGPNTKLDRARLRLIKQELIENVLISKTYVRAVAQQFLPGMRPAIAQLPENSNLIVMPSTTRVNRVPSTLAGLIKKDRPDLAIINAKEDIIQVAHRSESKIKNNYGARTYDPRRFVFNHHKLDKLAEQGRPSFIIDDSISTGESAFVLQRQLSKEGVYAQGVIAGVANEKYHVRSSDMRRLYEKMTQSYPSYYSLKQLQEDIHTHFGGFPRRKITNFERTVHPNVVSPGSSLARDEAYWYLHQSADYYRKQGLDPASVLERIPEAAQELSKKQRSLHDQLRIDFPNLSEKEINRYAEIKRQESSKAKGKDTGLEL